MKSKQCRSGTDDLNLSRRCQPLGTRVVFYSSDDESDHTPSKKHRLNSDSERRAVHAAHNPSSVPFGRGSPFDEDFGYHSRRRVCAEYRGSTDEFSIGNSFGTLSEVCRNTASQADKRLMTKKGDNNCADKNGCNNVNNLSCNGFDEHSSCFKAKGESKIDDKYISEDSGYFTCSSDGNNSTVSNEHERKRAVSTEVKSVGPHSLNWNEPRVTRQDATAVAVSKPKGPVIETLLAKLEEAVQRQRGCVTLIDQSYAPRITYSFAKARGRTPVAASEAWNDYCSALPGDFFSSPEACMANTDRIGKGQVAYNGLLISVDSCPDLKTIWEAKYIAKNQRGHSTNSFDQQRSTLGMYLRAAVVLDAISIGSICQPGGMFRALLSRETGKVFVTYLQARTAPSTVRTKVTALVSALLLAEHWFASNGHETDVGNAKLLRIYYLSVMSVERKVINRETNLRRVESQRKMDGKSFTEEEFRMCVEKCKKELTSMMASIDKAGPLGGAKVQRYLLGNPRLLRKWCIFFTSMVLMTAGGQRPQVYGQLQTPEESLFESYDRDELSVIELRTLDEKTTRATEYPLVPLPLGMISFLQTHCFDIRPAIFRRNNVNEPEDDNHDDDEGEPGPNFSNALLLHTESGEALQTTQIRMTLKVFLKGILGEKRADEITPMTLRSSHASIVVQRWRDGLMFAGCTKEQMLDKLASLMNTSAIQLENTYLTKTAEPFVRDATEVASMFDD
jgi:hypothetical protein